MAVDACGARVSPSSITPPGRAPRRGPDLDRDRRTALVMVRHCSFLCTAMSSNSARAVLRSAGCQARHIASKQLQSQQRLIKPLRSRRYRGRVSQLSHTVTAARRSYCVDSDAFSGFAFRCRKWFRIQMPKVVSDGATTKQTDGRGRNLWTMRGAQARVRSSGPLLGIPTTRTR